jgi:hypothetical protein
MHRLGAGGKEANQDTAVKGGSAAVREGGTNSTGCWAKLVCGNGKYICGEGQDGMVSLAGAVACDYGDGQAREDSRLGLGGQEGHTASV